MITTDNACQPDRFDPASLSTLSGLEIVNGLADGRLPRPPMAETLPFTVLSPSAGRVIGTVIWRSRTVITAEGRIEDDGGRLYAYGTSSCLVVGIAAQARAPQPSAVAKLSRRDAATVAMVNLIP